MEFLTYSKIAKYMRPADGQEQKFAEGGMIKLPTFGTKINKK